MATAFGTETLFEDPELVVRALPGDPSKPTLVTFSSAGVSSAGPGFWGSGPAQRIGWPAVGFMAHRLNWYPAASMEAAAAAVRGRLGPVAVGYGYSMGGYAALRYGRLLGLTHALALSPQASISPADLPRDIRYHVHFDPAIHSGMLVGPGHMPPRVWVIFDPDQAADAANRALLDAPGLRAMPVRGIYHSTIQLVASRPVLEGALEALLADDAGRLRRLIRGRQRQLPFWYGGLGATLIAHGHPEPGSRLMDRARALGVGSSQEEEVLSEALALRKAKVRSIQGDAPYGVLLGRLRTLSGLPAASHLSRSLRLAEAGLYREARLAAEQGLAEVGPHVGLLTHLGHLILSQGKNAKARSLLEDAVRLDPEEGWAWVGLSIARLGMGDAAGAEAAARIAVRLRPASPHASLSLGEALLSLGHPAEAMDAFRQAAACDGGAGADLAMSRAQAALATTGARLDRTTSANTTSTDAGGSVPSAAPAGTVHAPSVDLSDAAGDEAVRAPPAGADAAVRGRQPASRATASAAEPEPDPLLTTKVRVAQGYPPPDPVPRSVRAWSVLSRLFGRS